MIVQTRCCSTRPSVLVPGCGYARPKKRMSECTPADPRTLLYTAVHGHPQVLGSWLFHELAPLTMPRIPSFGARSVKQRARFSPQIPQAIARLRAGQGYRTRTPCPMREPMPFDALALNRVVGGRGLVIHPQVSSQRLSGDLSPVRLVPCSRRLRRPWQRTRCHHHPRRLSG